MKLGKSAKARPASKRPAAKAASAKPSVVARVRKLISKALPKRKSAKPAEKTPVEKASAKKAPVAVKKTEVKATPVVPKSVRAKAAVAAAPSLTPKPVAVVPSPVIPPSSPAPVVHSEARPVAVAAPSPIPRPTRQPRPVPIEIPPLLLEPDHAPVPEPALSHPAALFQPAAAPSITSLQPAELPEAYGTEQIFLAARDPFWVLASWDLNRAQRARYNELSASGALTVRLRRDHADGPVHLEVHAKPDSKDWFIQAGAPDTTFLAELGLHEKNSGEWRRISISKPTTTPRDRAAVQPPPVPAAESQPSVVHEVPALPPQFAPQEQVVFATATRHPVPVWFDDEPTARAAEILPGRSELPTKRWIPAPVPKWTETQMKALDELISLELRKTQHGSIELEELLRRHIGRPEITAEELQAPSSMELIEITPEELLGLAQPGGPSSLEAIPEQPARKFWFKVNAELIIYGSTEPTARVAIGGRPIKLREDGSFSYRFALPDGQYELPVVAISADNVDRRAAELEFSRATTYWGAVGVHPQDAALKAPAVENL